ncbi:unnamed protein product [Trichogramma brassicae]|uniref:Uncharacterized protein n=1 Tax=Trichogramma brassicae TaxID=86971 RepID=A0A6H5I0X5_9HYME|nr:unnamed protein product [Trichogramma brassicae]
MSDVSKHCAKRSLDYAPWLSLLVGDSPNHNCGVKCLIQVRLGGCAVWARFHPPKISTYMASMPDLAHQQNQTQTKH